MDEPLSNLDAALRVQTRADILKLQDRLETTTIYVTHDQIEAMTMGDRIAVMNLGVLQQIGPPKDLYVSRANTFVATFIGSPAMNLLPSGVLVSSLSEPVHAAVLARARRLDDAIVYLRKSATINLGDRDGNTRDGLHVATMGGVGTHSSTASPASRSTVGT